MLSAEEARASAAKAERAAKVAAVNAEVTAAKAEGARAFSPDAKADVADGGAEGGAEAVPDSPTDDASSVGTPVASPGPAAKTAGDTSSSGESFQVVPSPSPSPKKYSPKGSPRPNPPGLVEQAFAAIVAVAARVQTLESDTSSGVERCAPLEAYATRVFDDARCVADWRGVARNALGDDGYDNSSSQDGDDVLALFPKLASLYASLLRETATKEGDSEHATSARRVCWFVLLLIGQSAALDARRRFKGSHQKFPHLTDDGERERDEPIDHRAGSVDAFAAAPAGALARPRLAPGAARPRAIEPSVLPKMAAGAARQTKREFRAGAFVWCAYEHSRAPFDDSFGGRHDGRLRYRRRRRRGEGFP